jgi:hypothetical protein
MSPIALPNFGSDLLAEDEDDFWARFSELVNSFDVENEDSATAHEQCDRRLVKKIDLIVEPVLGPRGSDDELWSENLDFFGDGVRQLSFRWADIPPFLLGQLQALLVGEHEPFCILIKFHTALKENGELVALLALFHNSTLATRGFYEALRAKHV